jgi:ribosomal protein S18 acetylase RimI-like enzyme
MNQILSLVSMEKAESKEAANFSFEHYISESVESSGKSSDEVRKTVGSGTWTQTEQDLWFNINLDDLNIGYLWLEIKADKSESFICDIHLFKEYRGKGHGRRSMLKVKGLLVDIGAKIVGLCVFGNNLTARSLYKSLGFKDKVFNEEKNRYEMFLEL